MRHPEPEIVTLYRITIRAEPPRVCHTCEHYGVDGLCVEYFMKPPVEFTNAVGECDKWEAECPF